MKMNKLQVTSNNLELKNAVSTSGLKVVTCESLLLN
jgi:hypothetical protein